MQINSKLVTPLLLFGSLVLGALQVALQEGLTVIEAWQFVALVIGGVVTYLVPLTGGRWPSILKVTAAVLTGIVAAALPLLEEGTFAWDSNTIIILALAAINAFSVAIGTSARLTSAATGVADPAVSNTAVQQADPDAFNIVTDGGLAVARHVGT